MIDFDYAARNIQGVWRLAVEGPEAQWSGRNGVDRSVEGVFRSFWAVALTAPFSLLAFVSAHRAAMQSETLQPVLLAEAPMALLLIAELAGFLADWALSIGALVVTARALDAQSRTGDVIICFNWAQVMAAIAVSTPIFLFALTANASLFSIFYLPALGFAIMLLWRVLRGCLPLSVGMTIALLAMLALIGVIANATVTGGALFLFQLLS